MSIAIYPGSFDPPTCGHMDIILRASNIFDKVYVACMINMRKTTMFTVGERVGMLERMVSGLGNVSVVSSESLLAEFAGELGADVIVKGLRAMSDFEMEFQMSLLNRKMNPKLDTLFLTTGESFQYLSSSVVKEIGSLGGAFREFVPECVYGEIVEKLKEVSKNAK